MNPALLPPGSLYQNPWEPEICLCLGGKKRLVLHWSWRGRWEVASCGYSHGRESDSDQLVWRAQGEGAE